jgi:biopolymer transport protein ExbD
MKRLPMFFVAFVAVALLAALVTPTLGADTSVKGKIASVAGDKNEFVMTDANAKNWTLHLDKDGKVFINDKEAKLGDLQAGDNVVVQYKKDGEKFLARDVRCTRK